ncbi:MAG: RecX family transcriptional regulator [Prevotella sp.]|nr:RecX family transcriptional regulator [Prevotella sp.]
MEKEITEQQAMQRLAALCAKGEHCQHDLLQKMRQWGLDEQVQAQVMERLVAGRYVDDARYAAAFVRDKVYYNHWGRRKVEQALWMKRIDEAVVREALDAIDTSDYVSVLRPMLQQKRKHTTARSEYELNMKLMKWAVSRGFTTDVIRQCMTIDNDSDLDEAILE